MKIMIAEDVFYINGRLVITGTLLNNVKIGDKVILAAEENLYHTSITAIESFNKSHYEGCANKNVGLWFRGPDLSVECPDCRGCEKCRNGRIFHKDIVKGTSIYEQ